MISPHFSIKKFSTYQHYKTRNPPWIKLYRSILNDYEMRCLPLESRFAYIGLLILASETDNHIPPDYKFLSERIGYPIKESTLTPLITTGFLLAHHATPALAHGALCSSLLSSSEERIDSSSPSLQSSNLKSKKNAGVSTETWMAYAAAFEERWKVKPIRDRQTNGMMCKLVEKLGSEIAPQVAAFYLTHNKPFYVENRHPVTLLLRDCHGLHTQWATGTKATTSEAKQAELKDSVVEQAKRVEALLQGRRA